MSWPLISRKRHDELLAQRVEQIVALARILYPDGVPEEFQLLLNIRIPRAIAAPAEAQEPERELTPIEQAAEARAEQKRRDRERLTSIARTRPSQLAAAMTQTLARDVKRRAEAARPTHMATQVFERAKEEVLNKA